MITVAKMGDKLVEVVRITSAVQFTSDPGWILICLDFEKPKRKQKEVKWIPATTRFDWVRSFNLV